MANKKKNHAEQVNLVPLEQVDLIHTNRRNVINWIKQGKITGSKIGLQYYVDPESLSKYLILHLKKSYLPVYLEREIKEREEEIDTILSDLDDYIFYIRQFKKKVKPLYKVFIEELSFFIANKRHRQIFVRIALGDKIVDIAEDLSLTYDQVAQMFEYAVSILQKKTKTLFSYRQEIAVLKHKVRTLEILTKTQQKRLEDFEKWNEKLVNFEEAEITDKDLIDKLSKDLMHDLNLDTRTGNCLRGGRIYTLEDLLRYLKNYEIDSFLKFRSFGKGSLQNLKKFLRDNNFMDEKGNIDLLKLF